MTSAYHAKYFAHELKKRCPSDSVSKLATSLSDAQVDLNPHQIDAALFAFRSPLSKGAILADEVGLGKTIEAGILLSQKWAEQRRKLLIIVPANLRKQWNQELKDKFYLPSIILENKSFNHYIKSGNLNPFDQPEIIICSYQFASTKESYISAINWDLVTVDEAHRLRNVYIPKKRIANAIKRAIAKPPKVLLTATPLQNTLQELYGLVSIIDDQVFGDLKSFKTQFGIIRTDEDYKALQERLSTVCQRTLRRQVMEYIQYTNRIPITQDFTPSAEEDDLYHSVSSYLQEPNLYALPSGQRKLMTLILRKLLASSTFAISGTLGAMAARLEASIRMQSEEQSIEYDDVGSDYETVDELKDEWSDDDDGEAEVEPQKTLTGKELAEMENERQRLLKFKNLADSIIKNSKGSALLVALQKGFEKAQELGAPQKAIIFTESTRTQRYILQLLENSPVTGKIVLFNGSNNDQNSLEIYRNWIKRHQGTDRVTGSASADMRAALVDYFREEAVIMVATEAAAEGVNLQFCSLVVNYDLPWNPQRIEQRIGRCHRYGQKFDVVVVNFLNRNNAADQRVFELLNKKFQLFSGVFGASDDVLGSIESGIDFEKQIAAIYQNCRTIDAIENEFNALQAQMEHQIDERMKETSRKLLENFDEEVQEKLRVQRKASEDALNLYEQWLWNLTRWALYNCAEFSETEKSFHLQANPFANESIHLGLFRMGKEIHNDNETIYRIGHPLAHSIIEYSYALELPPAEIRFEYSSTGRNIAMLDPLVGKCGWLIAYVITVTAFETQDHVLLTGCSDDGEVLLPDQCKRMFTLSGTASALEQEADVVGREKLKPLVNNERSLILDELTLKNNIFYEQEIEKLERWSEDRRTSLKLELKDLEDRIRETRRAARRESNLQQKLKLDREKIHLDTKRDQAWHKYELDAREIDAKKEAIMDEVEVRLQQHESAQELFIIRWEIS